MAGLRWWNWLGRDGQNGCFYSSANTSYCGIAPRVRSSGTSVRSVRASRRGDARLKSLLIFSCNSLVRSSGRYGEYYRACRARGMGHGRALKAVARKRLRAIYAVMRDRVPYRE